MGRALARALAERGDALFLLGRDAAEMALSARDLEARGPRAPVGHAPLDLGRPAGFAEALAAADRALGGLDALVVTGGAFGRQEELAADPARLAALLEVNFTGTAVLCQQAAARQLSLRRVEGGTLGVPRRPRPGLSGARRAGALRQARLREDRDDRGAAGPAIRGRAGGGGRRGGAPHGPGPPPGLRPGH